MKILNSILLFSFISILASNAQECKLYIPGTVGTEIELTHYDKKDKVTGITRQTLTKIETRFDTTVFHLHQLILDNKGENPMENNFQFKCIGEMFLVDMDMYFNQQTMDAYKDMQMKVTADEMELPSKPFAGQKLKDGSIKMEVLAGPVPMKFSVFVTNRSVLAIEDYTTTAGTFNCIKISEDIAGQFGFIKTNTNSISWYSDKIGLVRSESYMKGKLESYSVLTSVKKK